MPTVDCHHEIREGGWLKDRERPALLPVDPRRKLEEMRGVAFDQRVYDRSVQVRVAQWRPDSRRTPLRRVQASENPVERVFEALATEWRHETSHISSTTKMIMHPSYQSIIGMGPMVVPLLLRRLQERPEHWFWALSVITRHNPVKPEDAGSISKMTEAWLEWGRQRGQI
jgi:hypothetical protein